MSLGLLRELQRIEAFRDELDRCHPATCERFGGADRLVREFSRLTGLGYYSLDLAGSEEGTKIWEVMAEAHRVSLNAREAIFG